MAKVGSIRQLKSCNGKRSTNPYQTSPCSRKVTKKVSKKRNLSTSTNRDWKDATCPVCMESPHNAVLLLCSSYSNGCRPYMCATSCRFSNCLEQYKKACTKLTSIENDQPLTETPNSENSEVPQLSCPICRGQVKGWTVVEGARKDLNKKKRTCMQENCTFVGNFKQLKKHVKAEHPLSRPREVDPAIEEKWKSLERERERNDVISAITSSDPSAIVMGDFVIEGGNPFHRRLEEVGGFLDDNYFHIDPFINSRSFRNRLGLLSDRRMARIHSLYEDEDGGARRRTPSGDHDTDVPVSRHHRRLLFGRMSRRSRNRES